MKQVYTLELLAEFNLPHDHWIGVTNIMTFETEEERDHQWRRHQPARPPRLLVRKTEAWNDRTPEMLAHTRRCLGVTP